MGTGIRYCLETFQAYCKQDRQCTSTYHVTLRRARATIVTAEKQ